MSSTLVVRSLPSVPARWWLLPLAVAALPFVVTHVALLLSIDAGHVAACVPYLSGCTSISRAARHGLANDLFQFVMLPVAALHALNWYLARRWFASVHDVPRAAASLVPLGVVAAVALAVYAYALGTDGDFYRWMRRFGITFYFACSYLAQLVFVHRLGQIERPAGIEQRGMFAIGMVLLGMGLASVATSASVRDDDLKNAIENVLEWNLALLMTCWFLLQARLWRRLART
jgi:hypothetical protein